MQFLNQKIWIAAAGLAIAVGCSQDPQTAKRTYVESGDAYLAQGKLTDAIIQYRNAIAVDPSFGQARFKLASAYDRSGDVQNALREYIRAADLLPGDIEAQNRAGNGLLAAGLYPEAKARASAVLAIDPKNVNALITLGNAMAGMKDLDSAIATAEQAVDADPTAMLAYTNLAALQIANGNPTAAEGLFKRATEVAPNSESARLALANFYWATRRPQEAERELKVALGNNPKSPSANRAMAVLYNTTGRPKDAEPYLRAYADSSNASEPKFALADFLVAQGRSPEASDLLKLLSADDKAFAPAKGRLAAIAFAEGRRADAYATLDEVLKRQPTYVPALIAKAKFLLMEDQPAEALALASAAVKGDPRSAQAHYVRGLAFGSTGAIDDAISSFEEAAKLRPRDMAPVLQLGQMHYARGDFKSSQELARQVIRALPGNGLAHLLLAKTSIKQNDLKTAEAEIKGLAAGSPDSPEVQVTAGDFYWAKGDLPRARTAYEHTLSKQPRSLDALTGMLRIDVTEKKLDQARARLESALARYPNDQGLLTLAGRAFMDLGDTERSEATFKHLLDVNPNNFQGYSALASIYVAQKRLDEAIQDYLTLARLNPKVAPAAFTMAGTILAMQGRAEESRKQYQKALELDPQMPIAANNLAWDYAERGENLDVALTLAQIAKSKLPNSAVANDTLGWVYYKKGLASLAVRSLEEAATLEPSDPEILYREALAHLANSDKARARQALERALETNRAFKEASEARKTLAELAH